LPSDYVKELARRGIKGGDGVVFPQWNPESSLDVMDHNCIRKAFLSLSSPGVDFGDKDFAVYLAETVNNEMDRIVTDHPDRFGAFATIPLPYLSESLSETNRALDELNLDGVTLLTNYGGTYLGDSRFDELMVELNRRKAVVFVHPTSPSQTQTNLTYPTPMLEFPFDTTRAATNLVFSGTLKRFPNIKFILSHAGGTVPFLGYRIDLTGLTIPNSGRTAPKGAIVYLRQLYYETALSTSTYALCGLQKFADPTRILFGSDFPYAPAIVTKMSIESIISHAYFSDLEKEKILKTNAFELLSQES
jgi:predicted TIM-barrel fold metal-dependent hydrolase